MMRFFRLKRLRGLLWVIAMMVFGIGFSVVNLNAGTIRTTIDLTSRSEPGGSIIISGVASNIGGVTAYHPKVFLYFGERVEVHEDWEENAPGEKIHFQTRFDCGKWVPGIYSAVVLLAFEERGGEGHRIYHFATVSVGGAGKEWVTGKIKATSTPVEVDPKRFWQKNNTIDLALVNNHQERVALSIKSFLGDGFYSTDSMIRTQLDPGERHTVKIGVTRVEGSSRQAPYTIDIQYETEGQHFSIPVKGSIKLVSRPVYLKVFGGICLLTLCCAVWWQYRRGGRGKIS